jgi:hypothetical protein
LNGVPRFGIVEGATGWIVVPRWNPDPGLNDPALFPKFCLDPLKPCPMALLDEVWNVGFACEKPDGTVGRAAACCWAKI